MADDRSVPTPRELDALRREAVATISALEHGRTDQVLVVHPDFALALVGQIERLRAERKQWIEADAGLVEKLMGDKDALLDEIEQLRGELARAREALGGGHA